MNLIHEKFASVLVSRVYLVDQCLLRQPYPAQQVGVARVGAKIVKLGVVWHRDCNGITGERTSTDSNWLIEKVYELDKAGGFRDDEWRRYASSFGFVSTHVPVVDCAYGQEQN